MEEYRAGGVVTRVQAQQRELKFSDSLISLFIFSKNIYIKPYIICVLVLK
jgi:hypothetical protein